MARRRPTFIWPSSTAVSTPGRPLAAQYRTPSAPWVSSSGSGVTTLPRDFDIFLRSGSSTQPEIAASVQGRQPYSSSWRTIVLNSQVRMISCAWGRRSMGNTRAKRSGSSSRRPAICGVSDDVAQVSMTSGSPTNPPGCTPLVLAVPVGHIARGVDRQAVLGREKGVVVVDRAVVAHGVPEREGDPEEPLTADVPVPVQALDPGLVAVAHVGRVPAQLAASLEQSLAQGERPHVPLAAGDDLEGAVPALVELDRVS